MGTIPQYPCTVIPPHILRHISEHGNAEQRVAIGATLLTTEELSEAREEPFVGKTPPSRPSVKRCNVYDAGHRRALPGRLILSERKNGTADLDAREAFNGSAATFEFFARVFGRNSIDDHGARIDSSVHYGNGFANAMWNGRQMIYGDGDGKLFNRFTAALDVIGHELTHGITQNTASLGYTGQAGALNEHLSDVFGIMVKQYTLGLNADESDWLIGAGLFGPFVKGKAIRSMAAPGTAYDDPSLGRDPQPAHFRDYQHIDNGGVHINSGIPNHAFYLAAVAIGGEPWDVLGRIWYFVLTRNLVASARFQEFANATAVAAGDLYGAGGHVHRAVTEAWAQVGLPVQKAWAPRLPIKAAAPVHAAAALPRPKWRTRPVTQR
jgi:Zn-dependent metalloprotease